uniref:Uncharacterized protein n=1 Tax=Compsopogon caeruleus TaxID=31354 RepID=A0A7S1T9S5_9RHOD|mmetsp:Transcript_13810/g.28340  ORF Transcript_13810/g.28340 Transcript_13810/m.28340 type:complete len:592 (+) Transcript_13810:372-2147(+)
MEIVREDDAVFDPRMVDWLRQVKDGEISSLKEIKRELEERFRGREESAAMLLAWLRELRGGETGAVDDIVVKVVEALERRIVESFNLKRLEEAFVSKDEPPGWLDAMLASPLWQPLLNRLVENYRSAVSSSPFISYISRRLALYESTKGAANPGENGSNKNPPVVGTEAVNSAERFLAAFVEMVSNVLDDDRGSLTLAPSSLAMVRYDERTFVAAARCLAEVEILTAAHKDNPKRRKIQKIAEDIRSSSASHDTEWRQRGLLISSFLVSERDDVPTRVATSKLIKFVMDLMDGSEFADFDPDQTSTLTAMVQQASLSVLALPEIADACVTALFEPGKVGSRNRSIREILSIIIARSAVTAEAQDTQKLAVKIHALADVTSSLPPGCPRYEIRDHIKFILEVANSPPCAAGLIIWSRASILEHPKPLALVPTKTTNVATNVYLEIIERIAFLHPLLAKDVIDTLWSAFSFPFKGLDELQSITMKELFLDSLIHLSRFGFGTELIKRFQSSLNDSDQSIIRRFFHRLLVTAGPPYTQVFTDALFDLVATGENFRLISEDFDCLRLLKRFNQECQNHGLRISPKIEELLMVKAV